MIKAIVLSISLLASSQLRVSSAPVALDDPPKKDVTDPKKKGGTTDAPKKGDTPTKKTPDAGVDGKK